MGRERRGVSPASESSIQISFQYRGVRCREKIPLKPTPANLKRAEQHRAAILHAISTGVFDYAATFPDSPRARQFADIPGQVITIEQHLENWLKTQRQHIKASTFEGYEKIVNNVLIPWFGDLALTELSRRVIRAKLDTLPAGNKRLANIQSVLRTALTFAMNDELIESNPLYGWTYARQQSPKEDDEVDPFTIEEQAAILSACPPALANLVQFALWTGLRTSELIALDWEDVDLKRKTASIYKALTHAAKGEAETTKTRAGKRVVRLLTPALEALRAQRSISETRGECIFVHHRTGERWTGDQQLRKVWVSILKKADVRYRRPYQTRHTYASMMLSAGEHPMWVAKQMGHSDWTMIARIYGRWMPDADVGAGSKAEQAFNPASRATAGPSIKKAV